MMVKSIDPSRPSLIAKFTSQIFLLMNFNIILLYKIFLNVLKSKELIPKNNNNNNQNTICIKIKKT